MKDAKFNPSYRSKREAVKTRLLCCVIAPFGTNLNPIKSLLTERGIENYVLYKLPFSGMSVAKNVENDISKSDLVIAVIDSKSLDCNTYYELGYAHGLGKRILIVVPPGLELPAVLTDTFYIRANTENSEAISFALDQALVAAASKKRRSSHPSYYESHPISAVTVQDLTARLEALGEDVTERDLEQIVISALKAGGISVIAQSEKPDTQADMAVWADELSQFTGNPILIEIKRRLATRESVIDATNQVSGYLEKSNSRWALILFLHGEPTTMLNLPTLPSSIMFLSVRDLIERLRNNSFSQVIRELLDRRATGNGF
jgi:hypothetical protein